MTPPVTRGSALPQAERCAWSAIAAEVDRSPPGDDADEGTLADQWCGELAVHVLRGTRDPGPPPAPIAWIAGARSELERGLARWIPSDAITQCACEMDVTSGRITGHIDLWLPSPEVVIDWKCGPRQAHTLPAAGESLQLGMYALAMGARTIAYCYPRELAEGRDGWDIYELTDVWRARMRARIDRVAERIAEARRGERGPVVGPACQTCYHSSACPAARDRLRETALEAAAIDPAALEADRLAELVSAATTVQRMCDAVMSAARAHVAAHGRLRLPDGRQYGQWDGSETIPVMHGERVYEHLEKALGAEAAEQACPISRRPTKASIAAAIVAPRGKKQERVDAIFDALRSEGMLNRRMEWGIK